MERRGSGGADVCCERLDLIVDLISIVSDDPRVKAIMCMASYEEGELFSIRKLARCVGLAPKNMARYVEELRSRGIIECVYESPKLRLYKVGSRFKPAIDLLRSKLDALFTPNKS